MKSPAVMKSKEIQPKPLAVMKSEEIQLKSFPCGFGENQIRLSTTLRKQDFIAKRFQPPKVDLFRT